ESMRPEYMNSVQLSFLSDRKLLKNMFAEANLFYNKATNFIVASELGNANAGMVESAGMEIVVRYDWKKFRIEGNLTTQNVIDADQYDVYMDARRFYNIPGIQANAIATFTPNEHFRAHVNARYTSRQNSVYAAPGFDPVMIDIPQHCLVNLGMGYNWKKIGLEFNIYNLLNTHYLQGGSSVAPLQQPGLWLTGGLSFRI
ncbi:MAG: TonB-dependent receptor, partial [Bacteroidales bacterium]|nr:TonB-dependent receptor [Candidatus Cacconaster merdequi]